MTEVIKMTIKEALDILGEEWCLRHLPYDLVEKGLDERQKGTIYKES